MSFAVLPRLAIDIKYFSEPVEGVLCDFRKGPPGWHSVRANAYLNNIFAAPAPDLVFPMVMNRVPPDWRQLEFPLNDN